MVRNTCTFETVMIGTTTRRFARILAASRTPVLLADRSAGCPQHTVELETIELTSIEGAPAAIRGHCT